MLKKIIRHTIGIFLILVYILLICTMAYAGYQDSGIIAAIIYPSAMVGLSFGFLFLLAWMWKRICIANNLTPQDIEEITGYKS